MGHLSWEPRGCTKVTEVTSVLPFLDPGLSRDHRAVVDLARGAAARGGRALLVGGWVRDALLALRGRGRPGKDLDVEVFGLDLSALRGLLAGLGPVDEVGASFAVLRVRGIDVDFSLPRRDTKDGVGHRGFLVAADPHMSLDEAARRRDFTINAISMDPLTGEVLDPVGGVRDLEQGLLRATDPGTFGEDPLRALRGVQFAARFALRPAPSLPALMQEQDLRELPAERLEGELRKLLLRGVLPSRGLELFREGGCVAALSGLDAPASVWAARDAGLDRWARTRHRQNESEDAPNAEQTTAQTLAEGWALLTHGASAEARESLFERVRPPVAVQRACRALVEVRCSPVASPEVRRRARALHAAGTTLRSLVCVREALGEEAVDAFDAASSLGLLDGPPEDAVLGRDLLARGHAPGPELGVMLRRCRDAQDATGRTDVDALLALVESGEY